MDSKRERERERGRGDVWLDSSVLVIMHIMSHQRHSRSTPLRRKRRRVELSALHNTQVRRIYNRESSKHARGRRRNCI